MIEKKYMNKQYIFIINIIICFVLLSSADSAGLKTGYASSVKLIEDDYQKGNLTLDEKAVLQIKAIREEHLLPDKYKILDPSQKVKGLKDATMTILDIKKNWSKFSDETRISLSSLLARTNTTYTYDSPGGFFKLHYDITGTDQVPSEDLNGNSVPDFIEKCASYCDTTIQVHLDLGYLTPPPDNGNGGNDMYDIYFEDMGNYGYAVPEGPGDMPWSDLYSYIVLNSNFIGFPPNTDPEGLIEGAAKATVAHEFHHAVQFAYDIYEGDWIMELDATYMEDMVFDLVNDNYNYLGGFFNNPQTSLMDNNVSHIYASFVWEIYLMEKYEASLMVAMWEGAIYNTIFESLEDTILARYGKDIDSVFADFTYWNFITSQRNDGLHYEEADNYQLISVDRTHDTYPVKLQNSANSIRGYGCNYITFYPGSEDGYLTIYFNGSDTRDWAAYIIKSTSINSHQIESMVLEPITFEGEIIVNDFSDYYSVTLVGVNLTEFSDGALFTYSADVKLPFNVVSEVLTLEPLLYSGSTRDYEYNVMNISSENDIFYIIYWDDLGWLPLDTLEKAILSEENFIFDISVNIPVGTPINLSSNIYFKAISWGDNDVFDMQAITVNSVLQRGDLNSSGGVDIDDMIYFVQFTFEGGPEPLPVLLSGDFNCDGNVDIDDLIAFVDYSFKGGPGVQCNPY